MFTPGKGAPSRAILDPGRRTWSDVAAGLADMARVARRRIVYFSEPTTPGMHWLADDYLREIFDMTTNMLAPRAEEVAALLGGDVVIESFPVPADFSDGAGAFWARPERYCEPEARATLSAFSLLDPAVVRRAIDRLQADLADGTWDRRHGHLRHEPARDVGYRIVVSTAR